MGRRGQEGKNEVSSVKTEVLRSTAVLSSGGASVLHSTLSSGKGKWEAPGRVWHRVAALRRV